MILTKLTKLTKIYMGLVFYFKNDTRYKMEIFMVMMVTSKVIEIIKRNKKFLSEGDFSYATDTHRVQLVLGPGRYTLYVFVSSIKETDKKPKKLRTIVDVIDALSKVRS